MDRGFKQIGSSRDIFDIEFVYCPWFACTDCARAIIQAGIKRCVGHSRRNKKKSSIWDENIKIAFQMLDEAGIEYEFIDHKFGYKIRMGKDKVEV